MLHRRVSPDAASDAVELDAASESVEDDTDGIWSIDSATCRRSESVDDLAIDRSADGNVGDEIEWSRSSRFLSVSSGESTSRNSDGSRMGVAVPLLGGVDGRLPGGGVEAALLGGVLKGVAPGVDGCVAERGGSAWCT